MTITLNVAVAAVVRTFAGHNKWSQIRHKKAIKDVRRAKVLAKASRAIMVASRSCGGDVSDLRLASALAHAQAVELPKERIQEALASFQKNHNNPVVALEHHRYDAMLPLAAGIKVACVITAVTDNHKRTAGQIRAAITKVGGDMLPTGKLDFMFQPKGVIMVEQHLQQQPNKKQKNKKTPEKDYGSNGTKKSEEEHEKEYLHDDLDDNMLDTLLWECAIEHGATQVESDDPTTTPGSNSNNRAIKTTMITCEPTDLWKLVTALQQHEQLQPLLQQQQQQKHRRLQITEFDIRPVLVDPESSSTMMVELTTQEAQDKLEHFLNVMEEHDDVTNVVHNAILLQGISDDDDDDDEEEKDVDVDDENGMGDDNATNTDGVEDDDRHKS